MLFKATNECYDRLQGERHQFLATIQSQSTPNNFSNVYASSLMQLKLTKVFQKVPQGYIGFVEELPGANTQGDTLEDARSHLEEAIELVLEANRALAEEQIQGEVVIREAVIFSAA